MDVNEVIAVEEFVERAHNCIPQSKHCALYVSARSQMGMISQIFRRESLLLYGIGLKANVNFLEHLWVRVFAHLWVTGAQDFHGFRE